MEHRKKNCDFLLWTLAFFAICLAFSCIQLPTVTAESAILNARLYHLSTGLDGEVKLYVPETPLTYTNRKKILEAEFTEADGSPAEARYTVAYYKMENGTRTVLPDAPVEAGSYEAELSLTDGQLLAEESRVFPFVIRPYAVLISNLIFDGSPYYDGQPKTVTPKTEQGVFDQTAYEVNYYTAAGEKLTGAPVHAGDYRIELVFENPNYTVSGASELNFTVAPRPLSARFELPQNSTYDRKAKKVGIALDGVVAGDRVTPTLVFERDGQEIPDADVVDAGEYSVSVTTDNPDYIVRDRTTLLIAARPARVAFSVTEGLVYDGAPHSVPAAADGILEGDDVSISVVYNGEPSAPIDAGEYRVGIAIGGADASNYAIDAPERILKIAKADYPFSDFSFVVHAKKIIVVTTDFGSIPVRYSLDGINWQTSGELTAEAMQTYTVRVRLEETKNYREKILTATAATGFDPIIFNERLDALDPERLSFGDAADYREILRQFAYMTDADLASIDTEKLDRLAAAYQALIGDFATAVAQARDSVGKRFAGVAAAVSAATLPLAAFLSIRRRRL